MSHKPFTTVGELIALLSALPLDAKLSFKASNGMPNGTNGDFIPTKLMWSPPGGGRPRWGVVEPRAYDGDEDYHIVDTARVMGGKGDVVFHDIQDGDDIVILLSDL